MRHHAGALTLTGNPTFTVNNSNGSGTGIVTLGALNDGGVARTITVTGGGTGTSNGARLVFGSPASVFSAGTNILLNPTNPLLQIRLTNANGFGSATNKGLITFQAASGVQFLNNTTGQVFNTDVITGNIAAALVVGRIAAGAAVSHTAGTLSSGTGTVTVTSANADTNVAHSLTFGATTFTGDTTFALNNTNGTGIGSLTLGALDDGAVARILNKNGLATLQLNSATTSIVSGTLLSTNAGITQIGNATAFGSGTLRVGDGVNTGQLRIADGVTLSNLTTVTYLGGTATLGTGSITGPTTGTGTINSTINLNAAPGADTGHFQGGGGTLNITGPIVTGGTSGGEAVIRAGNVGLNNATGNTYTSLRVNAGTTTVGVNDAIPTGANVFLADLTAAAINIGAGISQTIGSGGTWTLGGTGPTLENNVGTIATGTGTLVLNGTLANNTGSLATQLVTGAVSFGGTSGTFNIDSGHATSDMTVSANLSNGSLIKNGAGILTLSGTKTLTGITVNGGTVVGGYGTGGVQTINVGGSGSIQLVDSAAETLTLAASAGALTLADGARLGFELGAPSSSDRLVVGVGGTAVTAGTITLDFYNLGALAAGTYTLLQADSGLTTGGTVYTVGAAPLGFNYNITAMDDLVQLITTANIPRFWTGSQATTSWTTLNAGPLSNFSTDAAGTVNSTDLPGSAHTVIFSATDATGPSISTTLDGVFTIDALQFLAAPTGVTAVSIAAGSGGTLTLAPASSSAGIFVATNAGTATLAAGLPFTVGAAQTWNITGGGANGSALVVAADTAFNANVTKSGAGALTLSGTNTGSATLTLSAGILNLNSAAALGSAALVINGGTTLNNTSGGAVALSTTNAITLNGNFTFTGSQDLSFASNAVSLPTNVSITTTAGNLTFNGVITESGGSRSLTKLGVGALTLGGNNVFSGGVNLSAGILNVNNAGALGTGTLTITGGTLDNTSGSLVTIANTNPQTWNGNFAFAGSNNLNLGTGAVSLGAAAGTSRTVTVNGGTLTIGGAISNGAVGTGITKAGTGTLTLSGASTYTGNTVVQAGTLNVTGSLTGNTTTSTLTFGTVAGVSTVNVSGNMTLFNMQGSNAANAVSIYNQTGGTVSISPGTGNVQMVGNNSSGYGFMNLTGGTFDANQRFINANNGGVAVTRLASTFDHTNAEWFMVTQGTNSVGEVTVLSGGSLDHTGSSAPIGMTLNSSGPFGVLNLAGGTIATGAQAIRAGNSTSTVVTNNNSIVNLAAGTLSTGAGFTTSFGGTGTVANYYINFAGATVQTTAAVATFIPASSGSNPQVAVNATLFGAIDNSALAGAPSFSGGLNFNTNTFTSTITPAILGAQASVGVRQADMTVSPGTGYSGPPVVQFSTTGVVTGGTPASGYALVSGGVVTGIVITNPGTYTSGTTPTVTLVGGGGSGASVTVGSLTTSNEVGGLTASGGGQLTLAGANSYAGVTTVTGTGTVLASTAALGNIGTAGGFGLGDATSTATNAASIVINGGILRTSIGSVQSTDRLFTLTQNGGQLDSNNGTAANLMNWTNTNSIAYTGSGARTFTLGGANTGDNTFAPQIGDGTGGATTLAKTGAGRWILTNTANNYTGGTNIAAGTLGFNAGNTLGSTGNITFTGASTLLWNGTNTDDLSSRLFITDAITGTVDTGANNVTFANAVGTTGGTTGILRKAGAGALTLNAAAVHTGGTNLAAGTLNIGHASALGTGTFTVSGTSTIDNTTGSALTLTGNPAQSWAGNFTFTGTHDLNMGTGAIDLTANRTVTVTAGTLTVPGIIGDAGGDFGLTKAGAGTLVLTGVNTFGADDNITIQGGILRVNGAAALGANTNNILFSTGPGTLHFTDNATFGADQYFRTSGVAATIEVDSGKLVDIQGGPTSSATNGFNTDGGTGGPGASVVKTGTGTLRLSGGNGFFDGDGGWVVTQGTLSLAGNNTAVLGDATPATVALRLNGGTVSYDTDTTNIVNAAIGTVLQANSTVVSNVATAGAGITQRLNALTVNTGGLTLNVQGGSNVNSGVAGITAGATTLNGDVTFNITDPTGGGTTLFSLGAVTGGANSVTLTGNGDFAQTGAIASTAAASLTLGSGFSGLATLNQANTYSGSTVVNGGKLAFATSGNLGDASATNTVTLGGGTLNYTAAGAVDLTANRVITLTTGTSSTVEVSSGTGNLQVSGGFSTSGSANLTKTGLGTLTNTGALNLNGGNLTVSAGTMVSGLSASGIGALSVASGATLNLYDTNTLTSALTGLTLGSGSSLGFDLNGTGVNDFLNLTGTPTITSTVSLNFNNLGGLAGGNTYDLLTISAGSLNVADFALGLAPSGFNYNFSTINSNQTLRLTASVLSLRYWQGDVNGSWSENTAGATNWATDSAGTTDLGALPVATDTLVFSTTNATGPAISTTLDGNFTVDSIQFTTNPTGVNAVTIAQGTSGTLTISPVSANNGLSVATNAGAVTISAPVVAGANQTWEVIGGGANGSSLAVSGDVTFTGSVNKTGAGMLTISGTNAGAGGVNLVDGTLNINSATALGTGTFTIGTGTTIDNSTAGAITLTANNTQTWSGSYTFTGTQALNLGTGAVTMGNNLTSTVSASTLTVGGGVDDGASTYTLTKAGAGTLVLNGDNGYDGLTTVSAGVLTLAGDNSGAAGGVTLASGATLNINHNNALGTGTLTINGGTINNTSGSAVTNAGNNAQTWNSGFTFTGANALDLGTGAVTLNATPTVIVSGSTLTVGGVIDGSFGFTKDGAGTLVLSGLSSTAANNYSGTTILTGGTTTITTNAALAGALTIGVNNTDTDLSTLNLNGGSASFAGALLVQTNNATANTITIGTGQSLTVNGNVTVGSSSGSNTTTRLAVSGLGAFNVTNTATSGAFTVGGTNSTGGVGSIAEADFSGLTTMNVNLSGATSVITVNPNITSGTTNVNNLDATLRLAATSTLTATTLTVGGGPTNNGQAGQRNELYLGSTATTIQADTINVGTGSRDAGFIGGGGGTLAITDKAGTGRAAFNIGTGTSNTGVAASGGNVVDLTNVNATLNLSTLTIGGQNRNTNRTDTLTFATGTLDATTVVVGDNGGTANGTAASNTWTSNLNISGGSTIIGTGGLEIARGDTAVTGSDTIAGNVNISGGTVTIAHSTGLGAAVRLAHNTIAPGADSLTTNGVLSITGTSNVTVSGNIIKGSTTGAGSATVTLDGGTLNMSGNNIGGAGALTVTLNAQSGTLQNLAQLNNGGVLTKTTAGTLTLEGTNAYTGGTAINGGILRVNSAGGNSLGTTGTVSFGGGTLQHTANDTTDYSARFSTAGSQAVSIDTNGQNVTYATALTSTGGTLTKTGGAGILALSGANTYDGATMVNAGTLQLGTGGTTGSLNAASTVSVGSGATFAVNRSNTVTQGTDFSSAAITGDGAFAQSGTGSTILNAANTYTGGTTVSAGTLEVNNTTGSGTGTGSVTLSNTGTTLAGSGSIAGSTILGSGTILAPGEGNTATSNKTLTFTAATTSISAADTAQIQLGVTTADSIDGSFATWFNENGGTAAAYLATLTNGIADTTWNNTPTGNHDYISAAGTIVLGSSATTDKRIAVSLNSATGLTQGSIFNLLDWSTLGTKDGTSLFAMSGDGSFNIADNLLLEALTGGLAWDTSVFNSHGILVVVPEPSRALFLMLGLLGLLMRRRRR